MWFKRKKEKSDGFRKKYQKGDVILRENAESPDEAYIIQSGRVVVSRDRQGERITLATLKPGEIFGEVGLTEKRQRTTSVTAIEDVEVDVIDF